MPLSVNYSISPDLVLIELQDLRNHGDSPHTPYHNYLSMADDVAGFIDEHKLKDTTLIGHSMSIPPLFL
jgi:pimeloyl-ACP methyl ester carboxylesterase